MSLLTFIKVIVLVLVLQTQVLVLVLVLDTQVLILVLVLVTQSLLTTLPISHCNSGPTLHSFRDIADFCTHDPTPIPP